MTSLLNAIHREIQDGLQHLALQSVDVKPRWDGETFELHVGPFLTRQVRPIAGKPILILASFEELGWPRRIDDPTYDLGRTRPDRLKEALASLNEGLLLLRFRSDGTGEGVIWEWA